MDVVGMSASEMLRYACEKEGFCKECLICCYLGVSCNLSKCNKWLDILADKIDAELKEARAEGISEGVDASLLQGAMVWAKANGWPDFRDGEDFGAWLERCAYKKPVDDCNEPVQFGDEIELHYRAGGMEKGRFQEVTINKGPVWMLSFTGVDRENLHRYDSECDVLKRPAPEVLAADGKPVKAGETVWLTVEDIKGTVKSIGADSTVYVDWSDGRWSPSVLSAHLTHEKPDTQESIDEDATLEPGYYCAERGIDLGGDPDRETAVTAMVRDLLKRQRALDARKGGDA